jgi:hypothetical protein
LAIVKIKCYLHALYTESIKLISTNWLKRFLQIIFNFETFKIPKNSQECFCRNMFARKGVSEFRECHLSLSLKVAGHMCMSVECLHIIYVHKKLVSWIFEHSFN